MDDLRPTMPDDLRTRIGKTLHRLYGPSLGAHPDGWHREPGGTQEMYLEDADAVIRELGMTEFRVEHPVAERWWATKVEPIDAVIAELGLQSYKSNESQKPLNFDLPFRRGCR